MKILINGSHKLEIESEPTSDGWKGFVLDIDEETGAKCVVAIAYGDNRLSAMNWAAANYFLNCLMHVGEDVFD